MEAARAELKEMMAQKDAIEAELSAIYSRLHSGSNPPGLSGNLVDKEGFPRADIDIAAVRLDRQRHNCLSNDIRDLMNKIGDALGNLHSLANNGPVGLAAPTAMAPSAGHMSQMAGTASLQPYSRPAPRPAPGNGNNMETDAPTSGQPLVPFAVVDELANDSPAHAGGIRLGDRMCSFGGAEMAAGGSVAAAMTQVADVLSGSEGNVVRTVVLRDGQYVTLSLTPQKWSGRGLLGCHLAPL